MSNRFGQAYGLTLFTPILPGADKDGVAHVAQIRGVLRELDQAAGSPFANVPTTHLARWVVIDEAPFEGLPARVDHLESKYLLFTSNFDTSGGDASAEPDTYFEALRTRMPETLDALYSHCVAFPGTSDAQAFRAYMRRCQVDTSFYFGAYADATVDDVLRAIDVQRRFATFVADHQERGSNDDELQAAFADFMTALEEAPTPRPGVMR